MELNVPLHPDPDYLGLLAGNADRVRNAHFGLDGPEAADARVPLARRDLGQWIAALARLRDSGQFAYLLLNARFHGPRRMEPESLAGLVRVLESLAQEPAFQGLVYADGYFLRALGQALPAALKRLEAVPSVNCGLDSAGAARAHLDLIERAGFAAPSRLVLDRSLNRDPDRLVTVAGAVRALLPGVRLELLANEGCLRQCPYRPAHESVVAARHDGGDRDTYALNRDLGCVEAFLAEPWRVFASPFIRPEDAARHEGLVDGLKICGRNRGGAGFLTRAVRAWLDGRYAGNLLGLLDTLGEFEHRFLVDNHCLPEDFTDRVSGCEGDCRACAVCRDLAREHLRILEPEPGGLESEVRP